MRQDFVRIISERSISFYFHCALYYICTFLPSIFHNQEKQIKKIYKEHGMSWGNDFEDYVHYAELYGITKQNLKSILYTLLVRNKTLLKRCITYFFILKNRLNLKKLFAYFKVSGLILDVVFCLI